MKKLIVWSLALSSILSVSAFAEPVYVQVDDTVAAELIGSLVASGSTFVKESDSRFVLDVNNVVCLTNSNSPNDTEVMGGIRQVRCFKNGNMGSVFEQTGKPLAESRAILEILEKNITEAKNADGSSRNLYFTDCAMGGRCGGAMKQVHCVVNPTIDQYSGKGRMLCKLFLLPETNY